MSKSLIPIATVLDSMPHTQKFSRLTEPVTVNCPACGNEFQTRVLYHQGPAYRCRTCFMADMSNFVAIQKQRLHEERLQNIPRWLMERGLPKRHAHDSFETVYKGRRPSEFPCLLTGPAGTGKTTLAACYMRDMAIKYGFDKVLFVKEGDLARDVRPTDGNDDRYTLFDQAKQIFFLVLDDLGKAAPTPFMREQIFHLIDYRHAEELPTIITTNLSLEALCKTYGANHAEALLSRLAQMGRTLVFRGKDRRLSGNTNSEKGVAS